MSELAKAVQAAQANIRKAREENAMHIAWAIAREIYGTPVPDSATRHVERVAEAIQEMV